MKNIVKISFYVLVFFITQEPVISQTVTWQRTYDGGYNYYDDGRDICNADEGNFYVLGSSQNTQNIVKVLKINSYGDTIWTREFSHSWPIAGYSAVSDGKGGCVLTGRGQAAFFINYDRHGNINWQRFYGQGTIQLFDMKRTNDNGYIACGRKDSVHIDCLIIKIDSTGKLVWQKTILAKQFKIAYSILANAGGDYIIAGSNIDHSVNDTTEAFLMNLDSLGEIKWEKRFRIKNKFTSATSLNKINNGYFLSGETMTVSGDSNRIYFLKTNLEGDSIYSKEFYSPQNEFSGIACVLNQNRFVFGMTREKSFTMGINRIVITDSSGNIIREKFSSDTSYTAVYFKSLLPVEKGNMIFVGTTSEEFNSRDNFYALRTDSLLNIPPLGIINLGQIVAENFILYQNYPNPFNPSTKIKFDIRKTGVVEINVYDINGRSIKTLVNEKLAAGAYEVLFNSSDSNPALSSGIYFYELVFEEEIVATKKMILIK